MAGERHAICESAFSDTGRPWNKGSAFIVTHAISDAIRYLIILSGIDGLLRCLRSGLEKLAET